ncbi:MAG: hypothetical protein HZB53_06310 [Chloroflexi bacterium]|nr:hypothetical protein [Chloroflexota bacterium]
MKIAAYVIAVLVALAGAVFLLQGLRFLPSAVMYGKPEWVIIGALMIVAAVGLAAWTRMRK